MFELNSSLSFLFVLQAVLPAHFPVLVTGHGRQRFHPALPPSPSTMSLHQSTTTMSPRKKRGQRHLALPPPSTLGLYQSSVSTRPRDVPAPSKGKKKKQVKFSEPIVTSAYVFPRAEEDEEIEDSDEELPLWPFSAEMEDPLADVRHHFYRGIASYSDRKCCLLMGRLILICLCVSMQRPGCCCSICCSLAVASSCCSSS